MSGAMPKPVKAKVGKVKRTEVKVKICGITNWIDARRAIDAGADFLGFNFYSGSPRYVTPAKARLIVRRLPSKVTSVGVFVNETEEKLLEIVREVGLDRVQLHGDETPAIVEHVGRTVPVIKALRVKKSFRAAKMARFKHASALLLDGFDAAQWGGTGRTFDWRVARRPHGNVKLFLAGGITPENVGAAIRTAKPYAVDVCSGVEAKPGKKDPVRLKAFMREVRSAQKVRTAQEVKKARKGKK
jgi:phosphoribosylanthranilate isomerase